MSVVHLDPSAMILAGIHCFGTHCVITSLGSELIRVMVQKLYRLGTHFYQVDQGSHPMVISATRMGTYLLPGGLLQWY